MTIKTKMSWPFRSVFLAVILGLGGAMSMWAYGLGRNIAGFNPGAIEEQLAVFQEQVEKLRGERDQLSTTVNAA